MKKKGNVNMMKPRKRNFDFIRNIGFDYTGYGFIGGNMRTGIYMRLGFQAPYSSLAAMLPERENEDNEKLQENLEKSFSFSISAGPAFRDRS